MTKEASLPTPLTLETSGLHALLQGPKLDFAKPAPTPVSTRLIRLDEINEEGHHAYAQALANVYASLDPHEPVRLLYLLDGGSGDVNLYFGVTAEANSADLHEALKNLRGALEGQLPGINFGEDISPEEANTLLSRWQQSACQGVVLGAPTGKENSPTTEELSFQGIDRLVHTLQSGVRRDTAGASRWQLAVISQPLTREQIRNQLDAAYRLSSQIASLVRTSVQASGNTSRQRNVSTGTSEADGSNETNSQSAGKSEGGSDSKSRGQSSSESSSSRSSGSNSGDSQTKTFGINTGTSKSTGSSHTVTKSENHSLSDTEGSTLGITQEIADKRAQHLMDYLDKRLIARLERGLTKGLFHSAIYLTAENKSSYQRLKNAVRAIFQGSETTLSPLEIYDLSDANHGRLLRLPMANQRFDRPDLLFHSLHADARNTLGSLLTADELAIVAGLPQREVKGVRRRRIVDFIVDLPDTETAESLELGAIMDRGRRYPNNPVRLNKADLNKHSFITGVTGAGKTTTCLNLLLESGLPFLVIEPVKTEYRELANHRNDIEFYRPNGDAHQSLRINPFALLRKGQRIKSHASFIKSVFTAVFPMEASMPMMIEAAILAAYEEKGWDIDENVFLSDDDPFQASTRAWPTMSDMIRQLDHLIPTYKLGKELEEKYRGSLVSRLRSLTDGTLGRVLDVPQSIDFQALLERHAVIELEELQGGEEKALLMALLLGGLNEAIRALHEDNPEFRHLTLVEEAHRLLARPEPGDKAAAMAVESFADMLAEVRKYGAGLIIADQIPAKLIPDVIKNTHTKIVHRLLAEDDRRAMGEAMMMDEEQRGFLPELRTGEAVIFCGGWHGPAHAAIRSDLAQTHNQHETFNLAECGVRQLWRERKRYYPQFCALGWLSEDEKDQEAFAQFISETRQAQNQFLRLITCDEENPQRENAFKRLKSWYTRWLPETENFQANRVEGCSPNLLNAAWVTLLQDANPQPRPEKKEVPPLYPLSERKNLSPATAELFECLGTSTDADSFKAARKINMRDLATHYEHLANFKKI